MSALNCDLQLRKTFYWVNLKKKKKRESISLEENKLRFVSTRDLGKKKKQTLDFSCSKVLPLHI